jgi:hypothetical protein
LIIVRYVQRWTARKLISLLLLAALFAGGESLASMAMPMDAGGMHMASMQKPDMDCKACGAAGMAAALCDTMCAALAAIDPLAVNGPESGLRARWVLQPEIGRSRLTTPDTSPPRL